MFRVSSFITLQMFNLPMVVADNGNTKHIIGGASDSNSIKSMYSGFIYSYRMANYVLIDFSGQTGEECEACALDSAGNTFTLSEFAMTEYEQDGKCKTCGRHCNRGCMS